MAALLRLTEYAMLLFALWGLGFHIFVWRSTRASDALISGYRAELESFRLSTAPSFPSADTALSAEWREAQEHILRDLEQLSETSRQLSISLRQFEQSRDEALSRLADAKKNEGSGVDHADTALEYPTQTGLAAVDIDLIEDIVSANHYGSDINAARQHRDLLQTAKNVIRLSELHCLLENWRLFLQPFIDAVERRPDHMLYNYI